MHIFIGVLATGDEKRGGCEDLGSFLTLSTLLVTPKLDCQKLKSCLSKYFIVDSSLSTKSMSQIYLETDGGRPGLADAGQSEQD